MAHNDQQNTYLSRLGALGLLRENMLYANPTVYNYTDIAEDLPGHIRGVAPVIKNILPSAAIISSDPEKRKQQIEDAAEKIKATHGSKANIPAEMWSNVKHMAPTAATAGTLLGAIIPLLGFRKPWARNVAGKVALRSPSTVGENIKKLLADPEYRKEIGAHALEGGLYSATHGTASAAILPLLSSEMDISNASLRDAKKIMQEQGVLTSLPGAEIVSAIKDDGEGDSVKKRLQHGLLAAGVGAATALPYSVIPAGISTIGALAKNILTRTAGKIPSTKINSLDNYIRSKATYSPITSGLRDLFINKTKSYFPTALKWGTGLGALGGALAKPLPNDQEQSVTSDQA